MGHTFTRASISMKSALQPEHCSGTHTSIVSKHGYLVYSSLLTPFLMKTKNDVDPFLRAQDNAFYTEGMHMLLVSGLYVFMKAGTVLAFEK